MCLELKFVLRKWKIEKVLRSGEFCHSDTSSAGFNLNLHENPNKNPTAATYWIEASKLCEDGDWEPWLPPAEAIVGSSKLD